MLTLPDELLDLIAQLLPASDIASFRLVDHACYDVCLRYFMDTVTFSEHEENMQIFMSVCQHPLINQYITTLSFDTTYFHPLESLEDFYVVTRRTEPTEEEQQAPYDVREERRRRAPDSPDAMVVKADELCGIEYKRYWTFISKQAKSPGGVHIDILKRGLALLPNLHRVTTSESYNGILRDIPSVGLARSNMRILNKPSGAQYNPEGIRWFGPNPSRYRFTIQQLQMIMDAVSTTGIKLVDLDLRQCLDRCYLSAFRTDVQVLRTMANIRKMALLVEDWGCRDPSHNYTCRPVLSILSACKGLEELDLSFSGAGMLQGHYDRLAASFDLGEEALTLTHLRKITLQSVMSKPSSLVDFLQRHRGTLRDISLRYLDAEDAGTPGYPLAWDEVALVLRQMELEAFQYDGVDGFERRLHEAEINEDGDEISCPGDCTIGRNWADGLGKFVLYGIGRNPLLGLPEKTSACYASQSWSGNVHWKEEEDDSEPESDADE